MVEDIIKKSNSLKILKVLIGFLVVYEILSVLFFIFLIILGLIAKAITGMDITGPDVERGLIGTIFTLVWRLGVINILFVAPLFFCILIPATIAYVLIFIPLHTRQSLERCLLQDLQSDDVSRRVSAIMDCGKRRLVKFEKELTTILLFDPCVEVRLCAYNALCSMNRPKLDLILRKLAEVTDTDEKIRLVQLLGKMKNEGLIDILITTYLENFDRSVRLAVLDSLSPLYSQKIADFLITTINSSVSRELKLKMLEMLDSYDETSFVEPLIILLKTETDRDVRLRILTILRDLKDIRCTEVFLEALHDRDIAVRNLAAETLTLLGVTVHIGETVKEIVKVPCKYCGSLVEVTDRACDACGAPLTAH